MSEPEGFYYDKIYGMWRSWRVVRDYYNPLLDWIEWQLGVDFEVRV